MPDRTPFALPLIAGLLTCLTIGLALRLTARTSARAPLPAHAGAPRADGLLPLSRLPASAADSQRQAAWWDEIADREYIQALVTCGLWGKHDRSLQMEAGHMPALRCGDLFYTNDIVVQPEKMTASLRQASKITHTPAATIVSTLELPMQASDDGPPRRLRMAFTRTASGLHVNAVFLPDAPAAH